MLREDPQKRPSIYEILNAVCKMQGKETPIRDVSILIWFSRHFLSYNPSVDILQSLHF